MESEVDMKEERVKILMLMRKKSLFGGISSQSLVDRKILSMGICTFNLERDFIFILLIFKSGFWT